MEQLLKILEDNARLSVEDIATMLNKSPAEVAAMIDLARAHGLSGRRDQFIVVHHSTVHSLSSISSS